MCNSSYKGDQLSKYIFWKISGENNLKQVDEWFKPMLTCKKEESHSWSIITHKKVLKHVNYVNMYWLRNGNPDCTRLILGLPEWIGHPFFLRYSNWSNIYYQL